ncbi:DUF7114 family protein [Halobacterium litoreum]|uniref:Uncharacterized protein n=1 Tax=Halobacterium litoreum TaxID=2039234 RepID=A0ABD5NEM2_9EURY|nr:hypothetical protein [Halobacterium litoreum]UHH13644.1 hypothetical protein LT972_01290 [Halobacterium litoreum]
MEEAEQARVAALEAVEDIEPDGLRAVIDDHVASSSMLPGVLTVLSARVVDGSVDPGAVSRRAAGVQLIYEGLRVTRDLVADEPWAYTDDPDPDDDLDVLAADVLVARGFRLLARTEAAGHAVQTVREFGHEQTDVQEGRTSTARTLEANVFELAAIAGGTAAGGETPVALRQYVVGLADNHGAPPLPPAADALPDGIEDVMARVGRPSGDERVGTTSVGDR